MRCDWFIAYGFQRKHMNKQNPYDPPKAEPAITPPFKPRFDAGLLTARYLQTLGVISVGNMIAGLVFFDSFFFDITAVVLFWGAHYLARHSQTARKWTIGICLFNLLAICLMLVFALLFGTSNMTINIGETIHNPPIWQVFLVAAGISVLPAIPAWLLLSPEAKREFVVQNRR